MKYILLLVIFISFSSIVNSTRCYLCANCPIPFSPSDPNVYEYDLNDYDCEKRTVTDTYGKVTVTRMIGPRGSCKSETIVVNVAGVQAKSEVYCCDTPLCNK